MYCVRLKENHIITSSEIQKKIEQLELKTSEERFPYVKPPEIAYEAYFGVQKMNASASSLTKIVIFEIY